MGPLPVTGGSATKVSSHAAHYDLRAWSPRRRQALFEILDRADVPYTVAGDDLIAPARLAPLIAEHHRAAVAMVKVLRVAAIVVLVAAAAAGVLAIVVDAYLTGVRG